MLYSETNKGFPQCKYSETQFQDINESKMGKMGKKGTAVKYQSISERSEHFPCLSNFFPS